MYVRRSINSVGLILLLLFGGAQTAWGAAVTLLGSATFTTASGTKTVTATPAVGDLIVIVTAHTQNTSAVTPTDDNSSGTYTTIVNAKWVTSTHTMMIHIRNTLIASAVSTVFTHAPGASSGGGLAVLKVTGMSKVGAAAALQSAKEENLSAATPAPVFGAIPQSGNPVIGATVGGDDAGMTPRSSPAYTERADVSYITPKAGFEVMSINSNETSATITWGSAWPGSPDIPFCSAVIELDTKGVRYIVSGREER